MQIRDLNIGEFAIGYTEQVIAHEGISLDPGAWVDVVPDPDISNIKANECLIEVGPTVIEVDGVGYHSLCHEECHRVAY